MNPLLIAFGVSLLAGALSASVFAGMWRAAQSALATEKAAHQATREKLTAALTGVLTSEAGRSGEKARLEAVIASQKQEIATLETQKSSDPAVVRARLERLSGG